MIRRKRFTLCQYLILILMFLASMNVFEKFFYCIILAFVILLLLNGRKFRVDKSFEILILFSITYVLFYQKARIDILSIIRQFAYPICYFMGLNFLNRKDIFYKEEKYVQDKIVTTIVIISLGAFFHYAMNLIINIDSIYRNNIDIWSGEYLNATGQAALSIMAIAVFITSIFMADNFGVKLISVLGFIIIFMYNLILAGRSLIIITMATILIALIYIYISKNVNKKGIKIFFTMILFVTIVYIYVQNIGGIRDIILQSNLSMRMNTMVLVEDLRWTRKIQFASKMMEYPFGGGKIHRVVGGYAHELFLDAYSDAGIFAYILLILFMCVAVKNLKTTLKRRNITHFLKLLVLCMYVVLILEFMIEPILAGMPWMFCAFCFYQGLIYSFNHLNVKKS